MSDQNQETEVKVELGNLEKASNEINDILKAVSPEEAKAETEEIEKSVDTDTLTANPADHMFEDATTALMEEEVIQKASEPLLALAAFQAEAVEGIQKAIMTINAKVDEFIKMNANMNKSVVEEVSLLKSQLSENADLIKSFGETPAESFKSSVPAVGEELKKSVDQVSKEAGPSSAFVFGWMEKAVQENKLNPIEVAKFEATQQVPESLKPALFKDWQLTQS